MASLALHGLMHGSKHIPDTAFEKIPVAGPRYFKEDEEEDENRRKQRRDRRDRRRQQRDNPPPDSDGYNSQSESDYERERRARRSHRRSERDGRRGPDRGYDSNPESPALSRGVDDRSRGQDVRSGQYNEAPRGYDSNPYFPPPPRIAVDEPQQHNQGPDGQPFIPRPYNPSEYNQETGSRDAYYAGHPQEQAPYTPPPGPPPSQQAAYSQPRNAQTPDPDAYHRSSVADRYRPSNANMYQPSTAADRYDRDISPGTREDRGSPRPNYPSAVAIRPHSDYYASQESLSPTYGRYDDEDYDDRHRRHSSKDSRRRSKSRRGSRSSSRVAVARDKVKDGFEKHKGELGASALGVVAGGLLGREFGGKKGNLGMAIGAALGGIGAGLYGKHQEKQKERERSRSRSMPRREYAGYESY